MVSRGSPTHISGCLMRKARDLYYLIVQSNVEATHNSKNIAHCPGYVKSGYNTAYVYSLTK